MQEIIVTYPTGKIERLQISDGDKERVRNILNTYTKPRDSEIKSFDWGRFAFDGLFWYVAGKVIR